jgi:hypothetical protein
MDLPGAGRSAALVPQGRRTGHFSRLDQLLPLSILLAIVLGQLLMVNLSLTIRGGPSDNRANYR